MTEAGAVWFVYGRNSQTRGNANVYLPDDTVESFDVETFNGQLASAYVYRLPGSHAGNRLGSMIDAGLSIPGGPNDPGDPASDRWLLFGEDMYQDLASGVRQGRAGVLAIKAPGTSIPIWIAADGWPLEYQDGPVDLRTFEVTDSWGLGHSGALLGDIDNNGAEQEVFIGAQGSWATYLTADDAEETPDPLDPTSVASPVLYLFWGNQAPYDRP